MIISGDVTELHRRKSMGLIKYKDPVLFRLPNNSKIETTYGRLCVWDITGYLPDGPLDKPGTKKLICWVNSKFKGQELIDVLKAIQDLGFASSTELGLSIC